MDLEKEEKRRLKEIRRAEKEAKRLRKARKTPVDTERAVNIAVNDTLPLVTVEAEIPPPVATVSHQPIPQGHRPKQYVVCLKHGSKYGPDYVNTLYNMCKRHLTVDYEFVCFTDDASGLNTSIRTIYLPTNKQLTGWWFKPMFFDKNLPLVGTILYMDLDIVIFRNIDYLFDFKPGEFCICRDFNRSLRRDWSRMNSSIFRLQTGSLPGVYDDFIVDSQMHMRRLHGDQDWIYEKTRSSRFEFWPDEWIQSYKWEMRDRHDLSMIKGVRNFREAKDPKVLEHTAIAVFHGQPHPHQCEDRWVKDNWK